MERSVYGRHRVFLPKQKNIIKKGGKAKNILRSVEMNETRIIWTNELTEKFIKLVEARKIYGT